MSRLTRLIRHAHARATDPQRLWSRLLQRIIPIRVAVIAMVKDEPLLIRLWFSYHARIFGAENIFIFDNGSTDPEMINALRDAKIAGANVDYSFCKPGDFGRKGKIVSALINRLMRRYHFFIPLDADELLTMPGSELLDRTGKPIFRHLRTLMRREEQFFRIATVYAITQVRHWPARRMQRRCSSRAGRQSSLATVITFTTGIRKSTRSLKIRSHRVRLFTSISASRNL